MLPGSRPWTALLLATFLLAAVLRYVGLQSGLWYDEFLMLVGSARHPVSAILTEYPRVNAHPLYNLLAHASIQMFGESAWSIRLPACVFGVASVMAVYLLGSQLTTPIEGWAASALLTTAYYHVWFSQNARGYTLLGFLSLVSTHYLLRAGETRRRREYLAYVLASAVGIYTQLMMAAVTLAHAAVLLAGRVIGWRPAQGRPLLPLIWAWTGIVLLSAAAYVPFAGSLFAIVGGAPTRDAAKVATASWAIADAVGLLISGPDAPAILAGMVLGCVGAASLWRIRPLAFALLVAPGVFTAVPLIALGQPIRPRFFFFLSGAAVIFVGHGIGVTVRAFADWRRGHGSRQFETQGIFVTTVLLMAVSAAALPRNYRYPKQDFDGAVQFLDAAEAQGATIAAAGPACDPLEIYYGKTWRCLRNLDDWQAVSQDPRRALVVYTLAEYVQDPMLLDNLRTHCPIDRRFPGTLGGGDLVVCEPLQVVGVSDR